MTEVINCGGGHRTRLRDNCCAFGVPLATYIKEGRRRPAAKEGRAIGGVQLGFPILVELPFLFQEGDRGKPFLSPLKDEKKLEATPLISIAN